jgi:hypothetical protein
MEDLVPAELSVEEIVESLVDQEEYNAYGIHKIVNATLKVLEVERRVPPQMIYNYSRNGLIEKGRGSSKEPNKNHVYSAELVKAFVSKWVNKNKDK